MKLLRLILLIIAAMATGGIGFFSFKVFDARQQTASLISEILDRRDPALDVLTIEQLNQLLRVEDPTFWTNNGLDFETPGQGMTTLTQGLGKQIYFDPFRPGVRKIELIILTRFALAREASKPDILQAFLTVAYLGEKNGRSVIGFAEASRVWYGMELGELGQEEYLSLVAMLIAPNALTPTDHAEALGERVRRIENLIADTCRPTGLRDVWLEGCKEI